MTLTPAMKVFEDFAYSAATETVDQQVDKFNDASRGALVLASARNVGNIKQKASFKAISNLIRRRNAYGSGALTPTPLSQRQENSVKVAAGTSPVVFERQQLSYIGMNPETTGIAFGEQLSVGMLQDQLNSTVRATAAAITGNGAVVSDVSGAQTPTATFAALNQAAAKFGDHAQNIVCWVMHSKVVHDLYGVALTSGAFLFNYGTVNVMRDPFGRVFVVTDSPALVVPGQNPKYVTLGLVAGAAMCEDNGDYHGVVFEKPGDENLVTMFQSEWTFNLGVQGYSWNAAPGGASPTDTALGTSANWSKTASFDKTTAGVALISA